MARPLAIAEHTNPLPIFRNVDEIKENAEGPRHDGALSLVQRLDPGRERWFGVVTAETPVAGQHPDLLDEFESLRAGEFADDRAEHVAEEPNIAMEGFVVGHGRSSGRG